MKQLSRIVVRGTNWIGDAVMTIAALREIRRIFHNSQISLLVKPWVASLFESADYIDELIAPRDWVKDGVGDYLRVQRLLAESRFDAAILLPNSIHAAVLAWSARIPLRTGFATGGRSFLLTDAVPLSPEVKTDFQLRYYLRLVSEIEKRWLGSDTIDFDHPQYELTPPPSMKLAGRELLGQAGLRLDRPVLALVPGSTNSRAKRWLPERFAEVADALRIGFCAQPVLLGARADSDVGDEVARNCPSRITNFVGKTSLLETMAVLANCDLLISNDTGPAHIAAAMRRPVLTIFGPTNFNSIRPYSDTAEMIHQPAECSPCMLRDCPIDHRCMTRISSKMVIEAASRMLSNQVALGANSEIADSPVPQSPSNMAVFGE